MITMETLVPQRKYYMVPIYTYSRPTPIRMAEAKEALPDETLSFCRDPDGN